MIRLRTVRILPDRMGPNQNYLPGQVLPVDDQRAKTLVETGHAEYADLPPELGTLETPEKIAVPKIRGARGGGR